MEQDMRIAKKIWKIFRIVFFMLRKGISKRKLLADLNMMMKRSKIAGKAAIHNLMFHHRHHVGGGVTFHRNYNYLLEMELMSAAASPVLPGFGPSPMVRQLRVTDSPFPIRDMVEEEDNHVDEAAEEFITKFYNDLKTQNSMVYLDYY